MKTEQTLQLCQGSIMEYLLPVTEQVQKDFVASNASFQQFK